MGHVIICGGSIVPYDFDPAWPLKFLCQDRGQRLNHSLNVALFLEFYTQVLF